MIKYFSYAQSGTSAASIDTHGKSRKALQFPIQATSTNITKSSSDVLICATFQFSSKASMGRPGV